MSIQPQRQNDLPSQEDLAVLEKVYETHAHNRSLMIQLQQIQAEFGYVPDFAIKYISKKMAIAGSHIYGVLTFYSQFSLIPMGKNIVKMCNGTACHVGGSKKLVKKVRSYLKLDDEIETTEDRIFTVQGVACLGCCALAPAMMVNDKVYGKLNTDSAIEIIEKYRKISQIEEE